MTYLMPNPQTCTSKELTLLIHTNRAAFERGLKDQVSGFAQLVRICIKFCTEQISYNG